MDFFADLAGIYKQQLTQIGCRWQGQSHDEIVCAFLNVLWRQIPSGPKRVHLAKEFICPAEAKEAFVVFCERASQGESISAYQSKKSTMLIIKIASSTLRVFTIFI